MLTGPYPSSSGPTLSEPTESPTMLAAQGLPERLRNRIVSWAALDRGFRARRESLILFRPGIWFWLLSLTNQAEAYPHFCSIIPTTRMHTHKHTETSLPLCSLADLTSLRRFKGDYSTFITSSEVPLQTQDWHGSPSLPSRQNYLDPCTRPAKRSAQTH